MVERETPADPHRRSAELIADLLNEGYPFTILIGFENEPENLYTDIERLGGVELLTVQTSGTTFFKSGSRWRRFLLRLKLAHHRLARKHKRDWQTSRLPPGPA